ncbi:hypothetical protein AX14_006868 [Amanita brunnescens Koide BX004]|nr:hypothetical protein AX14_006868 [Amanita brunnescens Koide BX004]
MSTLPKAVLYYSRISVWSSVAVLALEEKGYGSDEVDLKPVDISKGENYGVAYLRINPKATVPALVVPLENTLSQEIESRYKAITDSKTIVEFLDKSRSAISVTHTTSTAPAPSLTPATVEFSNASNQVISLLHSDEADPNHLQYVNAYGEASLRDLARTILPVIAAKRAALEQHLSDAGAGRLQVSDKVIKLWKERKAAQDKWYAVLSEAETLTSELTPEGKLKREEFFGIAAKAWGQDLKAVVLKLSKEIRGPFVLGDQFSVADVHLIAWVARVLHLAGATAEDDGRSAVAKLADRAGLEDKLERLGEFWEAARGRRGWQKVYGAGLH